MKSRTLLLFIILLCNYDSKAQRLYETCFNYCLGLPDMNIYGTKIIVPSTGNGSVSLMYPDQNYSSEIYLTRVDSNGLELWNKVISSNIIHILNVNDTLIYNFLTPYDICSAPDSGYYITTDLRLITKVTDSLGLITYFDSTFTHITNVDVSGNIIWSKKYLTPNQCNCDFPLQSFFNNTTNSLMTLVTSDSTISVLNTDTSGAVIWSKSYYVNFGQIYKSILISVGTSYLIGIGGDNNIGLIKIDSSGNIIWSNSYDSIHGDLFRSLIKINNGYILGINRVVSPHPLLIHIDENGNITNSSSYYFNPDFNLGYLIPAKSNGYLMFQGSSIIIPSGYIFTSDIWNIDSSDIVVKHKIYPPIQSGLISYTGYSYVNSVVNSKGLLNLNEGRYVDGMMGWDISLPFIEQLDSLGESCNTFAHDTLDSVLAIPLNKGIVNINDSVIQISVSLQSLSAIDSLLATYVDCVGYVGVKQNYNPDIKNQITFYPNPFDKTATLKINFVFLEAETSADIYNYQGVLLKQYEINQVSTAIDRIGMTAGIYLLKVSNKSGITSTIKIVVE